MFEKKDFSQLFSTMQTSLQEKSEGKFDFQEGSVVRTLFESFALEMAVLYEQMELVYFSGHIDTAQNTDLDKVVAILGIKRGEPEYAIGEVTFKRDLGIDEAIEIPINTLVTTEDSEKSPKKSYKTIELKTINQGESEVTVRVKAEEAGKRGETEVDTINVMPQPVAGVKLVYNHKEIVFNGKESETDAQLRKRAKETLLASSSANEMAIKNALLSMPGVREVKIRENFSGETQENQYGFIEVIVETADWFNFENQENRKQLEVKIDQVKAAGIYVLLKAPEEVYLDGTFLIEFTPQLQPTPEERAKLEAEIREKIETYVINIPMGQPLAISQLTKTILDVNGVSNIINYNLVINRKHGQSEDKSNVKRIDIEELEKFKVKNLQVASEIKPLYIDIEIKFTSLSEGQVTEINKKIKEYFADFSSPPLISKTTIKEKLDEVNININPDDIRLIPQFWQENKSFDGETIEISFVEKATLGNIFIYDKLININGAIKLILPVTFTTKDKENIYEQVRAKITTYLDTLKPEENVEIEKLVKQVKTITDILEVQYRLDDFTGTITNEQNNVEQLSIIDKQIAVGKFVKTQLSDGFLISADTIPLKIKINALSLDITIPKKIEIDQGKDLIKELISRFISSLTIQDLSIFAVGETIVFDAIKNTIRQKLRDYINNLSFNNEIEDSLKNLLQSSSYNVNAIQLQKEENNENITDNFALLIMEKAEIKTLENNGENLIINIIELQG